MANPRKFSEKIALHNQKQAEETAAFEKILREVSVATSKKSQSSAIKQTLSVNAQALGAFKGGSLPNVSSKSSSTSTNSSKIDDVNGKVIESTISKCNEITKTNANQRESRNRSVGVGPMRSRAAERKIDSSPYSSTTYLSPPPDSSWRRTNSDSAIHQSLLQCVANNAISNGSNNRWQQLMPTLSTNDISANTNNTHNRRVRSCGKSPRVPGINIYPSAHEPGIVQIPIGNNTGSLPDLTSVHFPVSALDHRDNEHSSSPYSSNQSPLSASPSTLSPTSVTSRMRSNSANFQYIGNLSQQNYLAVPSLVNTNQCHNARNPTNVTFTSETNFAAILDALDFQQDQSPPMDGNLFNNNNSNSIINNNNNSYSTYCEQKCSSASQSPTNIPMSVSTGYRSPNSRPSPQSSPGINSRNSETNSPATNTSPSSNDYFLANNQNNILQHLEQFSMDWAQLVQSLVDSGCTWNNQAQIENSATAAYDDLLNNVQLPNQSQSSVIGQTQIQTQPGQQLQPQLQSSIQVSQSQQTQVQSQSQIHQIQIQKQTQQQSLPSQQSHPQTFSSLVHNKSTSSNFLSNPNELPVDNSFFQNPSSLVYATTSVSLHTTPNTPTGIPDIILTDFSNNDDCETQPDITSDFEEKFDQNYYFATDESLKDTCCLSNIDFDGLQLLTDSEINIISDNASDNFQLEEF